MLAPAVETVRLFLHVLAATVWVGGQITLLGLLPAARGVSDQAPTTLARAFALVAWPAYGLLIVTGLWNVAAVHPSHQDTAWQVVFGVKMAVVALSGVAVLLHQRAKSRPAIAAWGSVAGISSMGALLFGVLLAG